VRGAANIAAMRTLDVDHLLIGNRAQPPVLPPNIDGHVLPYSHTGCLEHGTLNDVPIMTGHTSDEGGTYAYLDFGLDDFKRALQEYGVLTERFCKICPAS
jgi:carboxylesterase type B